MILTKVELLNIQRFTVEDGDFVSADGVAFDVQTTDGIAHRKKVNAQLLVEKNNFKALAAYCARAASNAAAGADMVWELMRGIAQSAHQQSTWRRDNHEDTDDVECVMRAACYLKNMDASEIDRVARAAYRDVFYYFTPRNQQLYMAREITWVLEDLYRGGAPQTIKFLADYQEARQKLGPDIVFWIDDDDYGCLQIVGNFDNGEYTDDLNSLAVICRGWGAMAPDECGFSHLYNEIALNAKIKGELDRSFITRVAEAFGGTLTNESIACLVVAIGSHVALYGGVSQQDSDGNVIALQTSDLEMIGAWIEKFSTADLKAHRFISRMLCVKPRLDERYVEAIKTIITTHKLDIHENNDEPLRQAFLINDLSLVEYLMNKGANVGLAISGLHELKLENGEAIEYGFERERLCDILHENTEIPVREYEMYYSTPGCVKAAFKGMTFEHVQNALEAATSSTSPRL